MEINWTDPLRFGRQAATGLTVACFALMLTKVAAGWWQVAFDQGGATGVFVDTIYASGWSYIVYMMIFRWTPGQQLVRRLIEVCFVLLISLGIAARSENLLGFDIPTAWRNPSIIGVTCLLVVIFWLISPIRYKSTNVAV